MLTIAAATTGVPAGEFGIGGGVGVLPDPVAAQPADQSGGGEPGGGGGARLDLWQDRRRVGGLGRAGLPFGSLSPASQPALFLIELTAIFTSFVGARMAHRLAWRHLETAPAGFPPRQASTSS